MSISTQMAAGYFVDFDQETVHLLNYARTSC